MKHAIKSLTGHGSSSGARVVDGKLILSFPQALTPVVWQMDLNQARSSALEVRDNKETGGASLVLKTPSGESSEIAPFEKRAQAIEALMAVSRALENAHGQIRSFSSAGGAAPAHVKSSSRGKWVAAILGVILLFVLLNIWGAMLPHNAGDFKGTSLAPVSGPGQNPAEQSGVPLSADEFLSNQ